MRWSLNVLKPMLALRYGVKNDGLTSYYKGLHKAKPPVTATLGPPLAMVARDPYRAKRLRILLYARPKD